MNKNEISRVAPEEKALRRWEDEGGCLGFPRYPESRDAHHDSTPCAAKSGASRPGGERRATAKTRSEREARGQQRQHKVA